MDNQQRPTVQHMELCSILHGSLDGRGLWGRMNTCLCMAESLCYSPETIITLSVNQLYPNTKQKKIFLMCNAKSLQSCPTLCDPIDSSPPGSPVPGILQARMLEWVAISFSNAWKWKVKVKSLSRVRLFATPRIAAHQAPPPMGFSRQEYWSGVPLLSPLMCNIGP